MQRKQQDTLWAVLYSPIRTTALAPTPHLHVSIAMRILATADMHQYANTVATSFQQCVWRLTVAACVDMSYGMQSSYNLIVYNLNGRFSCSQMDQYANTVATSSQQCV